MKKLNEKAANVLKNNLVKDLDKEALESVSGGGTIPVVGPGGCRTCGILVTTQS